MKNGWIKKSIYIAGLLILGMNLQAQRIGTWKSYMAYQNATLVAETPNKVFAVYDGSLLSYSPDDEEVTTYSKSDGLSEFGITHMAYSPETKALVLVYENSNIDIFLGRNNVYNLPFIKESSYTLKGVNNLELFGNYAYLSTDFGIVVVDLLRKEIKDDYKIGAITRSVCIVGESIYAATSNGILKASTSSNLKDKNNWKKEQLDYKCENGQNGDNTQITKLLIFNGSLVFYHPGCGVYQLDKENKSHFLTGGVYYQLTVANNQLILVGIGYLAFFKDFTSPTFVGGVNAQCLSNYNSKNIYWTAQKNKGLVGISIQPGAQEYTTVISGIQVNSPKRNLNYYMTFTQNKLLIAGGGRDGKRYNNPGTLMIYENGKWFNLDEDEVTKQIQQEFDDKNLSCMDFTSVAVDPRDPNHYFVSSWGEGVYEFKNNQFVKLYTLGNSTLEASVPGNKTFVRVDGLVYDKNNNLYMVNSEVSHALHILQANGEWVTNSYPDLEGIEVISQQVLISKRNNQKWINLPRGKRVGIFVLDEKNTIGNSSDDAIAFSGTFIDQKDKNIGATGYLCMAEDLNGTIWAGTDNGPILFNNAAQVNKGTCSRIILTDEYDSGYYLLSGKKITAIAVDGGNRKWIGTDDSGVFLVNQNQETISVENFNADNSGLISNKINSIAINPQTGEVFIGTDRGLVSYMSDAIEGKSDYSNVYAFPNPVRPVNNQQVVITGLMKDSNVKITDMAGNLIVQGTSIGGQYTWNCTGRNGAIVKSGIYLVFAATPDGGEGVVTKIMIIK